MLFTLVEFLFSPWTLWKVLFLARTWARLKSTLSLLIPVADQVFFTEEMYDPDQMFFTEGEQMFYPEEMGYYPGEGELYAEGTDYVEGTSYAEETDNPEEIYYEGDVADSIPMQSVMDPSGSVPLTYYGDDQYEELSDDNA